MKTILTYDYKYKKFIADNLQRLLAKKYTDISDEEYADIQDAIDEYLEDETSSGSGSGNASISVEELEELKAEIKALKPLVYDVQEDGLYFVDSEGYIIAKMITTGFFSINSNTNGEGSSVTVGELKDLTDVSIISPTNGQSLIYNSLSGLWKNTTTEGSISGDFTIIDY